MAAMKYLTIRVHKVPALGFGTWRLSGAECVRAVEHALQIGYRHIDTAQTYENETDVGQGLQRSHVARKEIFLVTKIQVENFRREMAINSTHDSLKKLKTDYVDLLLIHWPSQSVPVEETLEAMLQLQEEGKIRHIGVSNFSPSLMEQAARYAPIFCNQVEYHPYLSQAKLLQQARQMDYLLTAYCPVARGKVNTDETLMQIGQTHGKTAAQVALRWLIQQDKVAVIPKTASEQRRISNLSIFDFELSEAEMQAIYQLNQRLRLVTFGSYPEDSD